MCWVWGWVRGVRVRTVSILVTERGTVRGAARAAAGAYDRESCWMDSIVRTCEAEAGGVGDW